mmetsp:Transcript_1545/g.2835  ORF Transcript_1545/g.2835 Transcript_1545/m.2835 type:complete len:265 (+) Transcript_1545:297-1091(+)
MSVLKNATSPNGVVFQHGASELTLEYFIRVHTNEQVRASRSSLPEDVLLCSMEEGPRTVNVYEVVCLPRPLHGAFSEYHTVFPLDSFAAQRCRHRQQWGSLQFAIDLDSKAVACIRCHSNDTYDRALRSQLRQPALADLARPEWHNLLTGISCGYGQDVRSLVEVGCSPCNCSPLRAKGSSWQTYLGVHTTKAFQLPIFPTTHDHRQNWFLGLSVPEVILRSGLEFLDVVPEVLKSNSPRSSLIHHVQRPPLPKWLRKRSIAGK